MVQEKQYCFPVSRVVVIRSEMALYSCIVLCCCDKERNGKDETVYCIPLPRCAGNMKRNKAIDACITLSWYDGG